MTSEAPPSEPASSSARGGRTLIRRGRRLLVPLIGWSLSVAMARSLEVSIDWWGLLACLAGVHAAYRFDNVVDAIGLGGLRGLVRNPSDPRVRVLIADGALLAGAGLASPRLVAPLLLLSVVGVLYVPLKRVVPKNLLTAGAWTASVFALSLERLEPTPQAFLAAGALFSTVLSNASLCDLPDISRDRENRVMGFATLLGARPASYLAGGLGLAAAALAWAAGVWGLILPGVYYAIVGWGFPDAMRDGKRRRVFIDAVLVTAGPISLLLAR